MKRMIGPVFDAHRIPLPPGYMEHAKIPESMRMGDDRNGCFIFPSPVDNRDTLRVMVGNGMGWDHVSVSLKDRCPTWAEMDWIKRFFFKDDEVAFQLHVPPSKHINCHPYTLHIWRPHRAEIPLPPSIMV